MVDLRGWLKQVQEIGELKTVCKANPLLEIGTLTEINNYQRGPALLFKDIPGYSSSYQLISSALVTSSRLGMTLGIKEEKISGELELFHMQNENKSNLGVAGKADVNFLWVDLLI